MRNLGFEWPNVSTLGDINLGICKKYHFVALVALLTLTALILYVILITFVTHVSKIINI